MGIELRKIDGWQLYVLRSDQGDGGWSTHTPLQMFTAQKHDQAPSLLTSGPSQWDAEAGAWARPNEADLRQAMRVALGTA